MLQALPESWVMAKVEFRPGRGTGMGQQGSTRQVDTSQNVYEVGPEMPFSLFLCPASLQLPSGLGTLVLGVYSKSNVRVGVGVGVTAWPPHGPADQISKGIGESCAVTSETGSGGGVVQAWSPSV